MISKSCLTTQMRRIFRLPKAPREAEDIKALMQEFSRPLGRCESDAHLIAVVDKAIDTLKEFPAPAELSEIVRDVVNPERKQAPPGCDECGGTGWRFVRENAMDFCECPKGLWMRKAASERALEVAKKT